MHITIHPTDQMVDLNGVVARAWEGTTESGVPVMVFVAAIGIDATKVNEAEVAALIEFTGTDFDLGGYTLSTNETTIKS